MEKRGYGSEADTPEAAELFAELSEADQCAIIQALKEILGSR